MFARRYNLVIFVAIILFSTLLASFNGVGAIQNRTFSESSGSQCPLSTFVSGQTQYVKNCYYEVGVNTTNGVIDYVAIVDGSNKSIIDTSGHSGAGLLTEELDEGQGGSLHFTNAQVSPINAATLSYGYLQEGVSGEIISSGSEVLSGTINMTFFAGQPYFIASMNNTIEVAGTHYGHDLANFVSTTWNQAWAGPGNDGRTEVCTSSNCSNYVEAESTFDTAPDIKSLIQRNGPTWGWLGTNSSTSSAEGVGFLLLGFNSTSPNEEAISHYEINNGDFEIEGTGVAPADYVANGLAPHAMQYSSNVPQKEYGAFLVYLNAVPYTTFENFISGYWKSTSVGSYLGSSLSYAAFAETGKSPNAEFPLESWYITNLATSVSAPPPSSTNGMIFFTGRNSSLANDFPMKMYLYLNGSDSVDSNFGTPSANVITNDGTSAKLQVVWTDTKDGLLLSMNFSTKSNSDKINVTGYVEAIGASLNVNSLALQENLFANYLDGSGNPSAYSSSMNGLSWNYTHVGISILLPSNSGISSVTSPNSVTGYMYLPSSSTFTKATFSFAVSFYDPVSNFSPAYTENVYVPTLKLFTQPFGNASEVGFTEDNSQIFSYLLSATQFNSNETIAAIQFVKPFSGDLEIYYSGSVSTLKVAFPNGTSKSASAFYNSATRSFNFGVLSITSVSLYASSTITKTDVACSPGSVAIGSATTCTARVTGNNPTGTISWQSSGSGAFSANSCPLSSGSCSIIYTPSSRVSPVTVNASYSGDSSNTGSFGIYSLNVTVKTSITVSCSPSSVSVGSSTTCTATVTASIQTGTVTWQSSGSGTFSSNSCTLTSGSCQVTYTPSGGGTTKITASYLADSINGTFSLDITSSPSIILILIIAAISVAVVAASGAVIFFRRRRY